MNFLTSTFSCKSERMPNSLSSLDGLKLILFSILIFYIVFYIDDDDDDATVNHFSLFSFSDFLARIVY